MDSFLRVGDITVALRCDDERIHCAWAEPFSRFLVEPASVPFTIDVEIEARIGDIDAVDGDVVFDSGSVWRMLREERGYRVECRSPRFGAEPYKIARFDHSFTRGTIVLREAVAHLQPLEYPLDELLIANLLGRGRGVELHSCGVIDREGRGHLFVGVSGAGKSTIARLWGGAAAGIVSDERVIVRETDGVMTMYGTPWQSDAGFAMAASAPLAGVYLLEQARVHELVALPYAAAVARLFRCAFPLFHDPASIEFTLSFLEKLAAAVPVRELRFANDRGAVDLVLRPMDRATEVILDLLARGHAVQFRARGDSMHPLIRSDEALHVDPVREADVGDVVLTLADRGLTAHRVIRKDGDVIVTRGDNAPSDDPPLPLARVLGRVRVSRLRRLEAMLRSAVRAARRRLLSRRDARVPGCSRHDG